MPDPSPRTVFADRLDQILKQRDMVRRDLSELADLRMSTINAWFAENSGLPNLAAVTKVAAALNVSIDYLAGLIDSETVLGEIPDDAEVVDLALVDELLTGQPTEEQVDRWLAWEPLVYHGMVHVPKRFKLVGPRDAEALRVQVFTLFSQRFPKLYEKWYLLYKKPLDAAKKRVVSDVNGPV